MDRENVIKGMELLYDRLLDAAKRDSIAMLDASMVENAITLLKEHEAVTPKYIVGKRNHFIKCGKCNIDLMRGMKYCPHCGQAVKWE
jgi:hypothetical protein